MSGALLEMVAGWAVYEVLDDIKDGVFGDDSDVQEQLQHVIDLQKETMNIMVEEFYEAAVSHAVTALNSWNINLKDALTMAASGDMTMWNGLVRGLADENSGVNFQLVSLFEGLMGENGLCKGVGLVGAWNNKLYANFKEDAKYGINNFLRDYDQLLCRAAALLFLGFSFQCIVVGNKTLAEEYRQRCIDHIQALRTKAWQSFPSAVRLFKSNYADTGAAASAHWWRLGVYGTGTRHSIYNNSWGTVYDGYRVGQLIQRLQYNVPEPAVEYRIDWSQHSDTPFLGIAQLRTRLDNKLVFYDVDTSACCSKVKVDDPLEPIVFRVVPVNSQKDNQVYLTPMKSDGVTPLPDIYNLWKYPLWLIDTGTDQSDNVLREDRTWGPPYRCDLFSVASV
ncbi:hypothetical protein FPV67DRAFT_1673645 [Lyophyllum atratum]|nr:hypothetical protein FPV67DRAFT_1673645 [Lyophyllum atratum]